MKVWSCGKLNEINIGCKVLVFSVGSGRTYFGEFAILERTTEKHLVFKTESGVVIKTDKENLHKVIGKAGKQGFVVSLNIEGREEDANFIKQNICIK